MRWFYTPLAILLMSGSLFGRSYVDPTSCAPCPPADPCAKCAQIWPDHGPDWIITPNAGPCVLCGIDVHISAEFIYWTGREDHLGFAYQEPYDKIDGQISIASEGSIYEPNWNFQPGFKVGVGILRNHDGWDVKANYTWLAIDNTKKTVRKSKENEQITPIGSFTFAGAAPLRVTSSAGEWQLDFNVVDLELGRNFFISRYLVLRPHFGLKGTWQKQTFDIFTKSTTINTHLYDTFKNHNHLDYWGIGIRAGLDSAWHLNRCTSVVGEISTTALWERFTLDSKAVCSSSVGAAPPITSLDVGHSFQTIHPVLELYLGARWETWFSCEKFHFSIEGGWEQQWWEGQNQFFSPASETREGNLVVQGFTAKIRIDF